LKKLKEFFYIAKKIIILDLRSRRPIALIGASGLLLSLLRIALGLMSWFFIGKIYYRDVLIDYKMDYSSFILLGIIISNLFDYFRGLGSRLPYLPYSRGYLRIKMSRSCSFIFILSVEFYGLIEHLIWIILQGLIAFTFFGITIPFSKGLLVALFFTMLGLVNETCLYMILSCLPIVYSKLRYQDQFMHKTIASLSIAFSTTYYPLEAIPSSLRPCILIFPRAVTLECIRLSLAENYSRLINYVLALIIHSLLLPTIAYFLFKKTSRKAEEEGLRYLRPL